jgi:hypothetical protein
VRNCTRDEGPPFEAGSQVLASSHRKLLSSKAMVVSVAETPGRDSGRQGKLTGNFADSGACPYRKSNPDVLMVQISEVWGGHDTANGLHSTRAQKAFGLPLPVIESDYEEDDEPKQIIR